MPDINRVAVLVAAAATFVIGGVYYGLVGNVCDGNGPRRSGRQTAVVEALRCVVLGLVVTIVVSGMRVDTWSGGMIAGALLWVGFPLVLLSGAAFHEGTPIRVAVVHAGDWLVKLLAAAMIVASMA